MLPANGCRQHLDRMIYAGVFGDGGLACVLRRAHLALQCDRMNHSICFLIGLRIKNSVPELCAGACHKDVVEKLRDKTT